VERQPKQAALAVEENLAADVEKRSGDPPTADDADQAGLLDDVQRRRVVERRRDVRRAGEP
jgi:hypothetical protein